MKQFIIFVFLLFNFQVFADQAYVQLGARGDIIMPISLNLQRKMPGTLFDANLLLKNICLHFPNFGNMTLIEFRDLVSNRLQKLDKRIQEEQIACVLDIFDKYFFCAADTQLKNVSGMEDNSELPTGIVLGLIEIGCGVLLWPTPFRNFGTGLMVDGARRIFNDLESIDKSRT